MTTELKIGEISKPRFEFRTFGSDFEKTAMLMSRLSMPIPSEVKKRFSKEIYIVSKTNDINNTKIREGKMDIKTLVHKVDGLEQWKPLMKGEFPIKATLLEKEVFPALQVDSPKIEKEKYSFAEFLSIVNLHADLLAVNVEKERYGYLVNNTICEYANVIINGATMVTVSSESTSIEDVKNTIEDLGLQGFENINYLRAIKRKVGMAFK